MPPSNLFFTEEFCPLSEQQKNALVDVGADFSVKDQSCSRSSINSCEQSIDDLLSQYPIFSPQSAISTKWGDIQVPWSTLDKDTNLNLDETMDTWSEARYKKLIAYPKNSLVIVVEDDGYLISLYKATEDIYAINAAFNPDKWEKVCSIETTSPTLVPSVQQLLQTYKYFNLNPYSETWGEYLQTWNTSLECEDPNKNIEFLSGPFSGETFVVQGTANSLPVRGYVYVPDVPLAQLDLVILYHGTITSTGTTPLTAAQNFLNIAKNPSGLNLGNKIIFSVAYPQDAIPGWTQSQANSLFPGITLSSFTFGDNLPYAEAAIVWAKNSLSAFLLARGLEKQAKNTFLFGHSQGAYLAHKLNRLQQVTGVISNAPGPIDLLDRCLYSAQSNDGNVTCAKMTQKFGSVYSNPQAYLDRSLIQSFNGTLAPTLFTQALDDTTGSWGTPQAVMMQNTVQPAMETCTNCAKSTFKYYETGGHDAFVTNKTLQQDIRTFIQLGGDIDSLPISPETCERDFDIDTWSGARTLNKYLYKSGDIVLSSSPCGDTICSWVAVQNLVNTPFALQAFSKFTPEVLYSGSVSVLNGQMIGRDTKFTEELVVGSVITTIDQNLNEQEFVVLSFDPSSPDTKVNIAPETIEVLPGAKYKGVFWQKIYCIKTGVNKCLEFSPESSPTDYYSPTEIGSMGHYVEVPEPYPKLPQKILNELARVKLPPNTLTADQIKSLKPPV